MNGNRKKERAKECPRQVDSEKLRVRPERVLFSYNAALGTGTSNLYMHLITQLFSNCVPNMYSFCMWREEFWYFPN